MSSQFSLGQSSISFTTITSQFFSRPVFIFITTCLRSSFSRPVFVCPSTWPYNFQSFSLQFRLPRGPTIFIRAVFHFSLSCCLTVFRCPVFIFLPYGLTVSSRSVLTLPCDLTILVVPSPFIFNHVASQFSVVQFPLTFTRKPRIMTVVRSSVFPLCHFQFQAGCSSCWP